MRRTSGSGQGETVASRCMVLAAVLLVAVAESLAQEPAQAKKSAAPESTRRIVVSIPDRKLALIEDGRVVKVFSVAVGAPGTPSPNGEFRIVNRIEKPTYYAPGKVIKPGPANPLGTRWIGLSLKGYGIHGTNEPISIGRRASHGCIRMRNEDVEELFELVRAGDVVELYRARTEQVAQVFAPPQAPAPLPAQAPVAAPVVVAAAVVR
jgi:lipoprotein-anchoring transpeptidase ErfK/SrfK